MQLPRGPPAGFVKLTKLNGVSWARGIRSVIVSNGCDRILPTGVKVPLDWLDDCAPAASAAGEEGPSAIKEVTPPDQSSNFTVPSLNVRRLSSDVEDVLMKLCCVQTQVIRCASDPQPHCVPFNYDEDYSTTTDDEEDLKSATSADFGGVTPSAAATRVFETSAVSPVYEPPDQQMPNRELSPVYQPQPSSAPPFEPVPPAYPEVAKPTFLKGFASFSSASAPMERGLPGYHTRSREAAVSSARTSAAGASLEPPPPPPVELPPAPGPPPMLHTRSCASWEHLLTGGSPPTLNLRDYRLINMDRRDGESLNRSLYGRMDMQATMANVSVKLRHRRVMAFSELGTRCRSFLGPVTSGILYPPDHGVSFGGTRRSDHEKLGYQFVRVPVPLCPVSPDFELLMSVARSIPVIRNIDNQRALDAGLAAEYFMDIRRSLAPVPSAIGAGSNTLIHGESRFDPALLGFSALPLERQEFMCLTMMLANMEDDMVKVYQDFATPRDILLDIRKTQSDALASRVPLMRIELHNAHMGPSDRVDDFFRMVRSLCTDLRSAGHPVTQRHAMETIVNGIRLIRFESLRIQYGMMLANRQTVDYWSCLEAYRSLDILNIALPRSDSRHPGWSRDAPQVPANAAFQRGQGSGSQGSGSNKRRLDCTWGPCLSKTTQSEDRCFTKHPHLRKTKPGAPVTNPVPMALALPGVLTPRQLASLQAQIDGDGVYKFAYRPCHTPRGRLYGAEDYPAFALDVDEDGGVVIPTTPEWLWHRRLGHPGYDAMHNLVRKGLVQNLPLTLQQVQRLSKIPCDACQKAKGKRIPFPKESKTRIRAPLQRLHLDIMGPFNIRGLRGEFYVLCLTDQYSGYAEVLCLRTRDEAPLAVQTTILRWMTQLHGFVFKCLRSDRAKEFIVKWFEDWLESVGAVHELSMAYTAQQNATVERYNGVLQNVARSIHLESKLTKSFWPYAFLAACYLRNRLPNQGDKTPYELFFGVLPDVSLLRVFGCPCYVTLVNGKKRNKLDERALSGRLVGYSLVI
eukprot:gene10421-biopygen7559